MSHAHKHPQLSRWVAHGLYPLLWLWLAGCFYYATARSDELQVANMVRGGFTLTLLLCCEWFTPYQARWGMNRELFFRRDLVFVAFNGITFSVLATALSMLAVLVAGLSSGPLSGTPIWLQVIIGLTVFEALQYATHRHMHESRGPGRHFLWRTHAIHHLPQQLYLVMHAVQHPFNALIVRVLVQLIPVGLLGYDPLAVFFFGSIIALHGTISHFNVDIRMGVLNYLFVGPELHRYHHSAKAHETVNYGAVLSLFDLAFGTFLYRPGTPPADLGLAEADGYPGQTEPGKALLFPLHAGAVSGTGNCDRGRTNAI